MELDIVITWSKRPEGFEEAPTERMIAVAEDLGGSEPIEEQAGASEHEPSPR
jgi:hypothetical protein